MKIGIQTNSLDKVKYGRWHDNTYKKLKEHGFSCSDFNMSDTSSEIYTLSQGKSDALLLHEKKLAENAGIELTQVHGPWRYPPKDFTASDREERMEKMKKSIRAASVLGCKNWVVHPLMPYGTEDINTPNEQKTWDINLEFMTELLKTAKEFDVTICIENMPMRKFSIAKPEKILRLVNTINDSYFKICLDTGHVAVFDNLVLYDEVLRLGNEIRVLHVHDNKYGIDMHLMPYFGVVDWHSFAKALNDIQFSGCFSLETVPPAGLPDNIFEDMCIALRKTAENICADI